MTDMSIVTDPHSFLRDEREGFLPLLRVDLSPEDYEPDEPDESPVFEGQETPTIEPEDDRDHHDPVVPVEVKVERQDSFFENPHTHPLVMDLLLLRRYGPEWMLWDSEVLELRIRQDFKIPDVPDIVVDKLEAIKTVHMTDSCWVDWSVFCAVGQALTDSPVQFDTLWAPTPQELAGTVHLLNQFRNDVSWTDPRAEELRAYMGVALIHGGLLCPVDPLLFLDLTEMTRDLVVSQNTLKPLIKKGLADATYQHPDPIVQNQIEVARAVREYVKDLDARHRLQKEFIGRAQSK